MEERQKKKNNNTQSQAISNMPGGQIRMAALPSQASPAHGASQQHPTQHYYPMHQTNGNRHHQTQPLQPAPTPQQQHDYRMPSNGVPAVSLPPIQHAPPSQPHYAQMNGDGLQIPHPQAQMAYQYQTTNMPAMIPPNNQVLYASRDPYRRYTPPPLHPFPPTLLPHNPMDPRQTSEGRHKKDIKRRTKTGCLTCRKRRIKCDERQPHCRNCEKSKRPCLGYDPIFKQQSAHAAIQPAPINTAPKPVNGMPLAYVQPQFHSTDDIYDAVRVQSSAAPLNGNGAYSGHSYAQAALEEQSGHPPGASQHYHPPFDPSHKDASQIPKV